jgi:tetratricopeptide (TPR) repeat protein
MFAPVRRPAMFARCTFPALLLVSLLVVQTPASWAADESWVGQRIMTKKAGTWIGHADPFGRPVYVAELTEMVYTVLKEQQGWLAVRQGGQEDWLEKQQAVLLKEAIPFFTQRLELNNQDAQALARRGWAWREAGELEKALGDFDRAMRLDPGHSDWFHHRGLVQDAREAYDQAIRDYDEAIRLEPNQALVYNDRGLAHKARKEYDQAIRDYSQALALDPYLTDAFFNRGNAYKARRLYELAVADYGQAIRLDPQWSDAYFNRAQANKARGAYERALSDYREVLRLDPRDEDAYGNLAWLLATCPEERLRDGRQAVAYATKACELTSWNGAYFLAILAAAYAERGAFEEALKWQQRALEFPHYEKEEGEAARRRIQLFKARQAYHEEPGPSYTGSKNDGPVPEKDSLTDPFPSARMLLQRLWR